MRWAPGARRLFGGGCFFDRDSCGRNGRDRSFFGRRPFAGGAVFGAGEPGSAASSDSEGSSPEPSLAGAIRLWRQAPWSSSPWLCGGALPGRPAACCVRRPSWELRAWLRRRAAEIARECRRAGAEVWRGSPGLRRPRARGHPGPSPRWRAGAGRGRWPAAFGRSAWARLPSVLVAPGQPLGPDYLRRISAARPG